MPAMPRPPSRTIELKATGKKESILGYPCEQFEIKNSGETMEIWATGDLLPFQPYIRSEPPRFGPRQLAEQWPELLAAKKLFPLRAILSSAGGAERYRFEVKSIMKGAIANKDDKLFQPPEGDAEVQPFPF